MIQMIRWVVVFALLLVAFLPVTPGGFLAEHPLALAVTNALDIAVAIQVAMK